MRRWCLLIGVVVSLVACGGTPATPTTGICTSNGGKSVYELLQGYSVNWEKAINRADTASRTALPAELESMRAIRRDLNAEQLPACGQAAQRAFVAMMDSLIEGFNATLESQSKDAVNAIFDRARTQKDALKEEVQKLVR